MYEVKFAYINVKIILFNKVLVIRKAFVNIYDKYINYLN